MTRQGGNGGARRPCGEEGNASALGSAPAAPGGSTVERGRCGAGRDPRRVGQPQGPREFGPRSEPRGRVRRGGASGAWASTAASSRSQRDFPGSLGSSPGPSERKPLSWWKGRSNPPRPAPDSKSLWSVFPRGAFTFCLLIPKRSSRVSGRALLIQYAASQLRGAGSWEGGRPPAEVERGCGSPARIRDGGRPREGGHGNR